MNNIGYRIRYRLEELFGRSTRNYIEGSYPFIKDIDIANAQYRYVLLNVDDIVNVIKSCVRINL